MTSRNANLFIDLDGTLLVNPVDRFLKEYFYLVNQTFQDLNDSEKITKVLVSATQAMISNKQPDLILEEVFNNVFYPSINEDPVLIKTKVDRFFSDIFPSLKYLTSPKVGAYEFIEKARKAGFQLIIATNPLFPRIAIEERLEWAGLSVHEIQFEWISSIENSHFSKPSPAYFAEILAHLGYPDEPVIVIGDNYEQDIIPAIKLGLPAFWTPETPDDMDQIHHNSFKGKSPDGYGNLENAWDWLKDNIQTINPPPYHSHESILAVFQASPAVVYESLKLLPNEDWTLRPRPKEWSVLEILCHLRDVDRDINLHRIIDLTSKDNPFITGIDSDVWAEKRNYQQQDPEKTLSEYIQARKEFLENLERIDLRDWEKPARHSILGNTNIVELMRITAEHDRLHIRQLFKTMQTIQNTSPRN